MKTLVCLHGFGGHPELWRPVLDQLEGRLEGLRIFCPALAGHGLQPRPATGFEEEVDLLAHGLETVGLGDCHLLAYSMGGRLALGLLTRHRRLFRGATLIGVHGGLSDPRARHERRRLDEARARKLETEGLEAFFGSWEKLPLFASQTRLPADVLASQRWQRRQNTAAGLANALRCLGPAAMPDYHPALGDLQLPVTLMVGALDDKFVERAERLLAVLPRARRVQVAGVGHNVALEAPAAVARTVIEDLTTASAKDNEHANGASTPMERAHPWNEHTHDSEAI